MAEASSSPAAASPSLSTGLQQLLEAGLVTLGDAVQFVHDCQDYHARVGWSEQAEQAVFIHAYQEDPLCPLLQDHPDYLRLGEGVLHMVSAKDPSAWMKNVVKLYDCFCFCFCFCFCLI